MSFRSRGFLAVHVQHSRDIFLPERPAMMRGRLGTIGGFPSPCLHLQHYGKAERDSLSILSVSLGDVSPNTCLQSPQVTLPEGDPWVFSAERVRGPCSGDRNLCTSVIYQLQKNRKKSSHLSSFDLLSIPFLPPRRSSLKTSSVSKAVGVFIYHGSSLEEDSRVWSGQLRQMFALVCFHYFDLNNGQRRETLALKLRKGKCGKQRPQVFKNPRLYYEPRDWEAVGLILMPQSWASLTFITQIYCPENRATKPELLGNKENILKKLTWLWWCLGGWWPLKA